MELAGQNLNSALTAVIGNQIKLAVSSLNTFAIELADSSVLKVTAVLSDGYPEIEASVAGAGSMPQLADAVCSVDWSWICGSTIESADVSADRLRFQLKPAGPLTVGVGIWQGSPFLSFQPFRPATN
jgi:hypothetical protein